MLLSSVALLIALADAPYAAKVDAIAAEALKLGSKRFAIAIAQDGKLVYAKGFSDDGKTDANSVFRIASITKQFTAALVVLLVREKKLRYQDKLGTFLPEVPASWRTATVRQLLTHTSGIPSYTDLATFDTVVSKAVTPREIWEYAATKKEMDFAPGGGWHYNNTGYALLGLIIEKATGKPYFAELQTKIFGPLGMKRSGEESRHKVVESYRADGKPSDKMSMTWPFSAGAIVSTVYDMARWDAALRGKFFTPEEKALMFTPDPVAVKYGNLYGFGWVAQKDKEKVILVDHAGGINGFSTMIIRSLKKGATVIVLAAKEGDVGPNLGRRVMAVVEPDLYPKSQPASADNDAAATGSDRALFEDLLGGKVDVDRFDEAFVKKVSPDQLKQVSGHLRSLGALSTFEFLKEEEKDGTRGRSYGIKLGLAEFKLMVAKNAAGKIVALLVTQR
ncbi:MAG: serine hydrolase domain-containing protein [Fimbriimonas sp.]